MEKINIANDHGGRCRNRQINAMAVKFPSDAKTAAHPVSDVYMDAFDCAVVIGGDSDVAQAMRLAKEECGKVIGFFTCMTVNHDIRQYRQVKPAVRIFPDGGPHNLLKALEPITADVHALNHFSLSLNTEVVLFEQVAEMISVDQVDCNSTVTGGLL